MKIDVVKAIEDKECKLNKMKDSYEQGAHAFNRHHQDSDSQQREYLDKLMNEIECLENELYGAEASSADSPGILQKRHLYKDPR
jgi:formate dehydrogenase maturation protein FdhE